MSQKYSGQGGRDVPVDTLPAPTQPGLAQARRGHVLPLITRDEVDTRWRTLSASRSENVVVLSPDGTLLERAGSTTDILGYSAGGGLADDPFGVLHPDDRDIALAGFAEVLDQPGLSVTKLLRARHAAGHWERMECTAVNQVDDPLIGGVVITSRLVTDQHQTEALLADEATILELIARSAPLNQILDEIERAVESHTGSWARLRLVDRSLQDTNTHVSDRNECTLCAAAIEQGAPVIVEDFARDPLTAGTVGQPVADGVASAWSQPIIHTDGREVIGTIGVYHDAIRAPLERERTVVGVAAHLAAIAVERYLAQTALENQALHDQLTGLPNRWALIRHLDETVERATPADDCVAVLLLDLDRFKVVNDSLGHNAGDQLLIAFGARLSTIVGTHDFVGHFGADEFVVVLENITDVDDVHHVASRLDLALSEPFTINDESGLTTPIDHRIFLSASIGVALSDGTTTAQQLLQRADTALHGAKERGGDRLEVFDDRLRDRATTKLRLDADLRLAVERAELHLLYQPKIDLDTGRISGVEALLRWQHPDRGVVLPGDFIGAAEESGLIVRIGAWVIDEAIRQARAWTDRAPGRSHLMVAVNLSARQLRAQGVVGTVERALNRYDWPADDLTLELTESILIDDAESTLDILQDLKRLGIKLAIDDFGTGYSSLSYLHRFPFDLVKVDRSFVTPLAADGLGSPVATAVISMAKALGLVCVAEGVETPEQLAGLRGLGCELAQGYWFAEPLPADELLDLLITDPTW